MSTVPTKFAEETASLLSFVLNSIRAPGSFLIMDFQLPYRNYNKLFAEVNLYVLTSTFWPQNLTQAQKSVSINSRNPGAVHFPTPCWDQFEPLLENRRKSAYA